MFSKNALVVDDSLTARTVLKHQLNQFDVVVESASDGTHALELLKSHTPDVIFLDHIMPGLDGFQVLQRLKDNQATKSIPVVMYTSQAAPQYSIEAKSLGAIAVIPKKVTDEQLMEALDKAELYQLKAVNAQQSTAVNDDVRLMEAANSAEAYPLANAKTGKVARTDTDQFINSSKELSLSTQSGFAQQPRAESMAKLKARPLDVANDESVEAGVTKQAPTSPEANTKPQTGRTQQTTSPVRGWLVALMLLILVCSQAYGLIRDQEQQQIINDLRQQVLLQEQKIPKIQSQLEAEQRHQREVTWRQVEFLMSILVDQLHKEPQQQPEPGPERELEQDVEQE